MTKKHLYLEDGDIQAGEFITDLNLVSTGLYSTITGSRVVKKMDGWISAVKSLESISGPISCSTRVINGLGYFGLTSSAVVATTQDTSLDYCFRLSVGVAIKILESGATKYTGAILAAEDVLAISYDGLSVTYTINGDVIYTQSSNLPSGILTVALSGYYIGDTFDDCRLSNDPNILIDNWKFRSAQKNSDITKAEIEAKLAGEITSHTHPASRVSKPFSDTTNRDAFFVINPSLLFEDATIKMRLTDTTFKWQKYIAPDWIDQDMGGSSAIGDDRSVFYYIPEGEHSAIFAHTSTYDATADVQAWVDATANGSHIYADKGTIFMAGTVTLAARKDLLVTGAAKFKLDVTGTQQLFQLNNCERILFHGPTFDGDYLSLTSRPSVFPILATNCLRVIFDSCLFQNLAMHFGFVGDYLTGESVGNGWRNCHFKNNGRYFDISKHIADGSFIFTGSGLDDASVQATHESGWHPLQIECVIDSVGAQDTFKYRTNYDGNGWTGYTTEINCTTGFYTIPVNAAKLPGAQINFAAITGHTLGDQWAFTWTDHRNLQAILGVSNSNIAELDANRDNFFNDNHSDRCGADAVFFTGQSGFVCNRNRGGNCGAAYAYVTQSRDGALNNNIIKGNAENALDIDGLQSGSASNNTIIDSGGNAIALASVITNSVGLTDVVVSNNTIVNVNMSTTIVNAVSSGIGLVVFDTNNISGISITANRISDIQAVPTMYDGVGVTEIGSPAYTLSDITVSGNTVSGETNTKYAAQLKPYVVLQEGRVATLDQLHVGDTSTDWALNVQKELVDDDGSGNAITAEYKSIINNLTTSAYSYVSHRVTLTKTSSESITSFSSLTALRVTNAATGGGTIVGGYAGWFSNSWGTETVANSVGLLVKGSEDGFVTSSYGLYVLASTTTGPGSPTLQNAYGVHVDTIGTGTNKYAFQYGGSTGGGFFNINHLGDLTAVIGTFNGDVNISGELDVDGVDPNTPTGTIRGAVGQVQPLFSFQDSNSNEKASVDKDGNFVGGGQLLTGIETDHKFNHVSFSNGATTSGTGNAYMPADGIPWLILQAVATLGAIHQFNAYQGQTIWVRIPLGVVVYNIKDEIIVGDGSTISQLAKGPFQLIYIYSGYWMVTSIGPHKMSEHTDSGTLPPMTSDLDMGGKALINARGKTINGGTFDYNLSVEESGFVIYFNDAATTRAAFLPPWSQGLIYTLNNAMWTSAVSCNLRPQSGEYIIGDNLVSSAGGGMSLGPSVSVSSGFSSITVIALRNDVVGPVWAITSKLGPITPF